MKYCPVCLEEVKYDERNKNVYRDLYLQHIAVHETLNPIQTLGCFSSNAVNLAYTLYIDSK